VHVSTAELENIFVEVFHSTEVVRKIRDRLTKYIKESKTDTAELNEPIEYCIDTDYQKLSEHLMKQFNTILNSKMSEEVKVESSPSKEPMVQSISISTLEQKHPTTSSLLNQPLLESCYEKISICKSDEPEVKKEKIELPKDKLLLSSTFLKNTLTHSRNLSQSRNLQDSLGVKFVLKYENGKARFVTVPADSREENKVDDKLGKSEVSMETVKFVREQSKSENSIPEETTEERVEDIILSLNRKSSKEETKLKALQPKNDEFSKAILKPYVHDLDDDLTAPYNKNEVKQFEKGFTESIYERLE